MKKENLVSSLLIIVLAICALAASGWVISFMIFPGMAMTMVDGSPPSDFEMFVVRVFIGFIFIGLINGTYKLWDLFVFCMEYQHEE